MILNLLQLSSPALPLGAYSYSEGLETLVEHQIITDSQSLLQWLIQDLKFGAIRLEAAVMVRAYRCIINQDFSQFIYWNQWSTATKETAELRQQSWQMGNTLIQLLVHLEGVKITENQNLELPPLKNWVEQVGKPCNYAIAFGLGAVYWNLDLKNALLGYLYSWATNLINAGVKLIPLGQTMGQTLLLQLHPEIELTTTAILELKDEDLVSCNWGLALASMAHETQYSRLFRS
ncbi:urease accessory protein UreF [Planktothrix mougeotii]|uniref:Urease accessory protein UreF n=1 Tax=Planktothrix mougeotii LEGE 06226 TaxID=1828728 RepID=A0ABR9UAB0_9CYAN|nr:urease accessory protein UreF [Planktothrix mougeotii]MBE9143388.1 urease accessory protein UreF [Planktothrix mougeotii LEGE 06226]